MGQVVSLLLAIFKAVPTIKTWWEQLVLAYVTYQENEIKKDIRDGIKKLVRSKGFSISRNNMHT